MSNSTNVELTLTKIHEGENAITFSPPLKLDCYLVKDEDGDYVNANFDFGLSYDFGLNPFYLRNEVLSWQERAERIVTFELFHSFFHPSIDPNFSAMNWALFANLAHRVACEEYIDIEDTDFWTYNEKLQKVLKIINYVANNRKI